MAIYIGGDTTELSYNFFGKIAGSMTECPMKCYYAANSQLLLPTDSKWTELSQERYDKIKNQDNVTLDFSTSTLEEKIQILIELDINGLCSSLYGGNNSILEQNIKSIQPSAVVRGQGANGGVLGHLSKHYLYRHDTNQYTEWGQNTTSSLITSSNEVTIVGTSTGYITENNKIYMLLVSEYPTNSTILNSLYLDYANIGLKLVRQPDVIPPIDVDLKDEWSILIKGFSPSWDSDNPPNPFPRVLELKNKLIVAYRQDSKAFYFQNMQNDELTFLPQFPFKKFQSINFLITQNKNKQVTIYVLKNGGEVKKVSSIVDRIVGLSQLYLLQSIGTKRNGDAFIDNIQLLNRVVTDQEAEIILKSKNPNLIPNFINSRWVIHSNATVSEDGKTLTLIAIENWQQSGVRIPVLPNNRYEFKCNKTPKGRIDIDFYYDNIKNADRPSTAEDNFIFTTSEQCNNLQVLVTNSEPGTFRFSDLELRKLD
ncbi:hypothetical protein N496_20030 (plasmid) [Clostridium botulinum A2B3 87]|uniref:hypothetical protein n=1 Tax=Clostridium botulinum TaxID=1491 RepID=UPI0004A56A07|nr:hypothetical protein [Clostridium botulinum]KEI94423.1 hypothetical protein N496_20030 [Clostridium botulinum A2B3 87]